MGEVLDLVGVVAFEGEGLFSCVLALPSATCSQASISHVYQSPVRNLKKKNCDLPFLPIWQISLVWLRVILFFVS